MDLAVVIVNFNTRDPLRDCLRSLLPELRDIEHEVLVVDNGSHDGSLTMVRDEFPQVTAIDAGGNLGFARANNIGLRKTRAQKIMTLNPDTVVQPGAIAVLLAALDRLPGAVAVGPKVIRSDGRLDLACRRTFPSPWVAFARLSGLSLLFPRSRLLARYNRTYENPDTPGEIDAGTAAALCFARVALAEVDFFDERFFMYGEDLDLCRRLKQRGGRIYYVPQAVVIHRKGMASQQQARWMLREFHHSMWLFYRKYYLRGWWAAAAPAVWTGIQLRHGLVVGWNSLRGRQIVSP